MNPGSSFFNNIIDDGSISVVIYDVLYFVRDCNEVISGDSCKRLDFVFERPFGIILGELKHDVDLVLKLIANIGFAEYAKLMGSTFLNDVKLIKVDAG